MKKAFKSDLDYATFSSGIQSFNKLQSLHESNKKLFKAWVFLL